MRRKIWFERVALGGLVLIARVLENLPRHVLNSRKSFPLIATADLCSNSH